MLGKKLRSIYEFFLVTLAVAGLIPTSEGDGVHVNTIDHLGTKVSFAMWLKSMQETQTKALFDAFQVVSDSIDDTKANAGTNLLLLLAYMDKIQLKQDITVSFLGLAKEEVLTDMATVKSTLDGIVSDLTDLTALVTEAKAAATAARVAAEAADQSATSARSEAEGANTKAQLALEEAQKIDDNVGNYP